MSVVSARFLARNVGTRDRVVRIIVGLALLLIAFTGHGVWGYLGFIPLVTGLSGTCPLYSLLGVNTARVPRP